jgi:hypothetical protein
MHAAARLGSWARAGCPFWRAPVEGAACQHLASSYLQPDVNMSACMHAKRGCKQPEPGWCIVVQQTRGRLQKFIKNTISHAGVRCDLSAHAPTHSLRPRSTLSTVASGLPGSSVSSEPQVGRFATSRRMALFNDLGAREQVVQRDLRQTGSNRQRCERAQLGRCR